MGRKNTAEVSNNIDTRTENQDEAIPHDTK